MTNEELGQLVWVACHDLRTPLATVNAVAKMMIRQGELGERDQRFAGMIDRAAGELASLVERLALVARIASGSWEPELREVDTLELAAANPAITVEGSGATVSTDRDACAAALAGLAAAGLRHSGGTTIAWTVAGAVLLLAPLEAEAAALVAGPASRDLDALVARAVLERLGARLALAADGIRVELR